MRQAFQLNAQVQWAVVHDEAAERWVAICDPMGITVEADSHTELRENITDAMNLVLVNLLRSGELDHFLRSRGWQAHPLIEQIEVSDDQTPFFDVPIELVARRANEIMGLLSRLPPAGTKMPAKKRESLISAFSAAVEYIYG